MQELECVRPLFAGGVVTFFKGKTNEYCVETYTTPNGNGFTSMSEYSDLVEAVTALYLGVYSNRDKDISIERMKRSLSHPRTILELVTHQGIPVGFGIFPRLLIEVGEPPYREPVIYSTRAFEKDYEGDGLGTHVLDRAIQLHQEQSLKGHRLVRYGALMSQNPLSVYTLEGLDYVEQIWPFGERYEKNTTPQSIMLGIHHKVRMSSLSINTQTGVSEGELSEIGENNTWRPSREPKRVWDIHQEMVHRPPDGLGMNREAGDVVYVTYRFKKPNVVSLPVIQTA